VSAVVAAALVAAVAAGCGTSNGPAQDAQGTVRAFLLDCRLGDGAAAQEALTQPGREVFVDLPGVDRGCSRILSAPGTHSGDFARARIASVALHSAAARVVVALPGRRPAAVTLAQGREGWLIQGPH
jgi:hypothetical protein